MDDDDLMEAALEDEESGYNSGHGEVGYNARIENKNEKMVDSVPMSIDSKTEIGNIESSDQRQRRTGALSSSLPPSFPISSYEARLSTTATVDYEEDRMQRDQDLKELQIAAEKHWKDGDNDKEERDHIFHFESSDDDDNDSVASQRDDSDKSERYLVVQQRQRSVSDHVPGKHDYGSSVGRDGTRGHVQQSEGSDASGRGLFDFWKNTDFSFKSKKSEKDDDSDKMEHFREMEERQRSNSTGTLKELWNRWFSASPDDGDTAHSGVDKRSDDDIRDFTRQVRELNARTSEENRRRKELLAEQAIDNDNAKILSSEQRKMEALVNEIDHQVDKLEMDVLRSRDNSDRDYLSEKDES